MGLQINPEESGVVRSVGRLQVPIVSRCPVLAATIQNVKEHVRFAIFIDFLDFALGHFRGYKSSNANLLSCRAFPFPEKNPALGRNNKREARAKTRCSAVNLIYGNTTHKVARTKYKRILGYHFRARSTSCGNNATKSLEESGGFTSLPQTNLS